MSVRVTAQQHRAARKGAVNAQNMNSVLVAMKLGSHLWTKRLTLSAALITGIIMGVVAFLIRGGFSIAQ